jgi:hypothetical protein
MSKTATTPKPAPYDRQPAESSPAWEAFTTYRDLGPERGIRGVAQKLRKSATLIAQWSAKWEWVARVRAWEIAESEKLKAIEDEEMKKRAHVWARRQMEFREREYTVGHKLLAKAEEILSTPLKRQGKTAPARFSINDASRMAAVGSDLIRRATGMATDKTEITGPDNAPIAAGQVVLYLPDNGRDKSKGKKDAAE